MAKPFSGIINLDVRDSTPDWSPFLQLTVFDEQGVTTEARTVGHDYALGADTMSTTSSGSPRNSI
jgi:hypothetical protein